MADAAAGAAEQVVQAGQRLEDAGTFLLGGLIGLPAEAMLAFRQTGDVVSFKFNTPIAITLAGADIAIAIALTQRYENVPITMGPFTYAVQHDRLFGTYCFIGPSGANPGYRLCR